LPLLGRGERGRRRGKVRLAQQHLLVDGGGVDAALRSQRLGDAFDRRALAVVFGAVGECRHQAEGQYGALLRCVHRGGSIGGVESPIWGRGLLAPTLSPLRGARERRPPMFPGCLRPRAASA
jgi:hypothetical protein